jgi:hypothetical protein
MHAQQNVASALPEGLSFEDVSIVIWLGAGRARESKVGSSAHYYFETRWFGPIGAYSKMAVIMTVKGHVGSDSAVRKENNPATSL